VPSFTTPVLQTTAAGTANNTTTCSTGSFSATNGSLLVAFVSMLAGGPIVSVSDSVDGTTGWTLAAKDDPVTSSASQLAYYKVWTGATASITVTSTQTLGKAMELVVHRIAGADLADPIGATGSARGVSGNSLRPNHYLTTTRAQSLVLAFHQNTGTSFGAATYTAVDWGNYTPFNISSGLNTFAGIYTDINAVTNSGTAIGDGVSYGVNASTGTANWNWLSLEIKNATFTVDTGAAWTHAANTTTTRTTASFSVVTGDLLLAAYEGGVDVSRGRIAKAVAGLTWPSPAPRRTLVWPTGG
jgi:hypothetical protein